MDEFTSKVIVDGDELHIHLPKNFRWGAYQFILKPLELDEEEQAQVERNRATLRSIVERHDIRPFIEWKFDREEANARR